MSRNLNQSYTRHQLAIENRVSHTVLFIIGKNNMILAIDLFPSLIQGGFLIAWTPYAITVFVRIFVNANAFPPIIATIPAMFAKTSVM